ncbi:hypothetical protein SGLAM104S_10335 [Streptomyces glaucescens]
MKNVLEFLGFITLVQGAMGLAQEFTDCDSSYVHGSPSWTTTGSSRA